MNNKIKVPIFHQPEKSITCSIASLKMIMDYYEDKIPFKELTESLKEWINSKEIHIEGVAIYLAKRGYEVNFIHHSPSIVTENLNNITEKDVEKLKLELKSIPNEDKFYFRKKKISLGIDYINAGGKLSTKIPTLDLIDNNIKKDIPTIICVNLGIWDLNPKATNNHYVVVVGKEKDKYLINDPRPKLKSPYKKDKDNLLMSWYRSGAYTLFTKKNLVTKK
ncbi:MAG: hypothetical protein WDZ80_07145 [Candidatus Paceibacterota bacterium]